MSDLKEDHASFEQASDHGTHVASVIAGLADGRMRGINPASNVIGVAKEHLPGLLSSCLPADVPVVNLSIGQKRDAPAGTQTLGVVESVIENTGNRNRLFIVAADEQQSGGRKIPPGERQLTRYGDRENVIVVAAAEPRAPSFGVDAAPLPRAVAAPFSDWHDELVTLAAPGRDVVGAVGLTNFAAQAGTSQATAIVSGAAALLHSTYPNLSPWQVKQRLAGSAELWRDDKVLSGHLNVRRAVHNMFSSVIKTVDGECVAQVTNGKTAFSFPDPVSGETERVELRHVIRWQALGTDSFRLLYSKETRGVHAMLAVTLNPGNVQLPDVTIQHLRGTCSPRNIYPMVRMQDWTNAIHRH